MLPLAQIVKAAGGDVAGSDRSRDQGRSADKFAALEAQGFTLFPQDGSGITAADQILVASAAIEDSVPEVARAKALGCQRLTRAELLSQLFNAAATSIGIAGTSGKSTVTGMIGWIMAQAGRNPTIMNGAVMKNFGASAVVGDGSIFVSEVDESDGSIALFNPSIALVNNVSLDHKSLDELHQLFSDFLKKSRYSLVNGDDSESTPLLAHNHADSFGFGDGVRYRATDISLSPVGSSFKVSADGSTEQVTLKMPGQHNVSNALAAIAASNAAGVPMAQAVAALASFEGLARRFDIIGTSPSGITVIDDFGHNPDKVRATLAALNAHPGRVLAFFQPHGFGPLKQMGAELAQVFATMLQPEDQVVFCDPVYFGGTVDRSVGSAQIIAQIQNHGGNAHHIADRAACGDWLVANAQPGDRIVILGARDDTLTDFAKEALSRLS